jgi:hypothetical protein
MFAVVGTAPLAVVGRVFNLWRLPDLAGHIPLLAALVATPTPPDLALPRSAWVAAPLGVHTSPASGNVVAHLDPGFPVFLTAHEQASGVLWDHVTWEGPTPAAGGHGWVRDSFLTSVGGSGPAVGDAGALSPSLANALAPLEPRIALAVYYPAVRQLYLADASQSCPLGNGARTFLLAALLAQSTGSALPSADTERRLAAGDATTASSVYARIGGSAGLAGFLSQMGLVDAVPDAAAWTQIQATPRVLDQFYTMLAGLTPSPNLGGLDRAGRARVLALVSGDPDGLTLAALGGSSASGVHVTLVVGAAQEHDGWTINAAGVLTARTGLTYVAAVCLRAQPTRISGEQALHSVFAQLATIATS